MQNLLKMLKKVVLNLLVVVLISGFGACRKKTNRNPEVIVAPGVEWLLYENGLCYETEPKVEVPCYEGGTLISPSELIRILDLIDAHCD